MELLEYVMYNYGQKNDRVVETLKLSLTDIIETENIDESIKRNVYVALGIAKGFTEYKGKELANELGVSKSAIKAMTNRLVGENKIELIKENNVTFIVPKF